MSKEANELIVNSCPICGERHRYYLHVIRDFAGAGRGNEKSQPDHVTFEKILMCPKLNQPFKYTVKVLQQRPLHVRSVSAEPMEDNNES